MDDFVTVGERFFAATDYRREVEQVLRESAIAYSAWRVATKAGFSDEKRDCFLICMLAADLAEWKKRVQELHQQMPGNFIHQKLIYVNRSASMQNAEHSSTG